MTETDPDYKNLTAGQLLDVERHINPVLVPERWEKLQAELSSRRASGAFAREHPRPATLGPVPFTILHMLVAPIVVAILIIAASDTAGEGAVGRDMTLVFAIPLTSLASSTSALIHRRYLAARNPGAFLLVSLVVTPIAVGGLGMLVLVLLSSAFLFLSQF